MIIKCLFGQMAERYDGEHAPELLCAVDEFVLESNEKYFEEEKVRVLSDGYGKNFVSIREIDIEVDQDEVRSILINTPALKSQVISPNPVNLEEKK